MTNIIVAFAKIDDAKSIKNILVKNGFQVTAVCTSGAQALSYADEFHDGIVICGYRLADMMYRRTFQKVLKWLLWHLREFLLKYRERI